MQGPPYAHSLPDAPKEKWESLADHLHAVAATARQFAEPYGAELLAEAAGWLHDFGKLDPAFQRHISGEHQHVDHAAPGAALAMEPGRFPKADATLLAAVVAGHHTGLRNDTGFAGDPQAGRAVDERVAEAVPRLSGLTAAAGAAAVPLPANGPDWRHLPGDGFRRAFLTRMVFSALVDADFLETERFYLSAEEREAERGEVTPLEALRGALDVHLAAKASVPTSGGMTGLRGEILAHVRAQSSEAPGVFTLTVPTGGGKTLASLAFALDHAIRYGLRRVIVVIPFTSVVEQTAAVYRAALGEYAGCVIEHHSAFDDAKLPALEMKEKLRLASENWDGRIIVTTAVQFFESLFASSTARCRKLHNIAGSVVVLDEAQIVPVAMLETTLLALGQLCEHYCTSVVLSTATQPSITLPQAPPALHGFALRNARELAPDPACLSQRMERVNVEMAGKLEAADLIGRVVAAPQVLTVLNTRRHVRAIFEAAKAECDGEEGSLHHLSTWMYAAHRSRKLAAIRDDLEHKRPCRVISTSLIEAGVDISFPLVLRAIAGLDQIAQAAGRCNRERELKGGLGQVVVFDVEEGDTLKELRPNVDAARAVMRWVRDGTVPGSLLGPEAIGAYFKRLYSTRHTANAAAFDSEAIAPLIRSRAKDHLYAFETIARRYRLIEDRTVPLIIATEDEAKQLVAALPHAPSVGGLARKLQRYIVAIPERERAQLAARKAASAICPERFGQQFVELMDDGLYRDDIGLDLRDPTFLEPSSLFG